MGIERVKEEAFETDGAARWSALSLNSYCDREGLAITACARSTMAYRALHEIVAMLMRN